MMNYSLYNYNHNPALANYYTQNNIEKYTIKVNGMGIINAEPDMAVINIGVVTESKDLQSAQKENALKSTALVSELYKMNIPRKDISTAVYNIEPQYDYIEGKQVFKGYRVTNIFNVKISELLKVGEIIDRSVASGANKINSIKFTLSNPSIYYNKALTLAVRDASLKAKEIGETLGVEVNSIPSSIVELSSNQLYEEAPTMKVLSAATPIEPGQITVTAKIEAVFNYHNYST